MGCACKSTCRDRDREERAQTIVMENLDSIGLWGPVEKAADATTAVGASHRYLRKAERAEALGLGAEEAARNRRAAERENRQARRLYRGALEELRERVGREDWQEVTQRLDEAYREQNGEEQLQDLRGETIDRLYEETDISSDDASQVVEIIDQTIPVAQEGMDAVARRFDEQLTEALAQRDDPDMGRGLRSPLTWAQTQCLVFATVAAIFATFVCLATALCWWWWAIAIVYGLAVTSCLTDLRYT
jgi:hypothetical protein